MTGAQRIASPPVDWQAAYGKRLSERAIMLDLLAELIHVNDEYGNGSARYQKALGRAYRLYPTLRKQVQKAEEK